MVFKAVIECINFKAEIDFKAEIECIGVMCYLDFVSRVSSPETTPGNGRRGRDGTGPK
jgi:hypothetical protein